MEGNGEKKGGADGRKNRYSRLTLKHFFQESEGEKKGLGVCVTMRGRKEELGKPKCPDGTVFYIEMGQGGTLKKQGAPLNPSGGGKGSRKINR